MRKLWLGIILGVLLVFLIFKYSEEIIQPEEVKNPLDKFTKATVKYEPDCFGGECSDEAVDWIIENGKISDCRFDEYCRDRYVYETKNKTLCSDNDCVLIFEPEELEKYYYSHIQMLRLSLDSGINICKGNTSDFISELNYLKGIEDIFITSMLPNDFNTLCNYLINGCDGSIFNRKCTYTYSKLDEFENAVSEKLIEKKEVPLYFVPRVELEHESFEVPTNKDLLLNELNENIHSYDLSQENPSTMSALNLYEKYFTKEDIYSMEMLSNSLSRNMIAPFYNILPGEKSLNFEFSGLNSENIFVDLINCNISDLTTQTLDLMLLSEDPMFDSWKNVFLNSFIFYILDKNKCEGTEKYQALVNGVVGMSTKSDFYLNIENRLPLALEFVYLFDVRNENLNNYLYQFIDNQEYLSWDLDSKLMLYEILTR